MFCHNKKQTKKKLYIQQQLILHKTVAKKGVFLRQAEYDNRGGNKLRVTYGRE